MTKLCLFYTSQCRLLLHASVLEPEVMYPPSLDDGTWKGKRTGIEKPFTQSIETKGIDYLIGRALKEVSPEDMVKPLKGLRLVSEYLSILRPLVYCKFFVFIQV